VIDTLSIGVPAFFLALAPNARRYRPGFVDRVLRFTIPAGIVVAGAAFAAFLLARTDHLPLTQQRTSATLVTLMASLFVLLILALPLSWRRALLVAAMLAAFVLLFPVSFVRNFYALTLPRHALGDALLIGGLGVAVLGAGWELSRRLNRGPAAALGAGARSDHDRRA
jgi:cation-transporting ATPase E